MRTISEPCLRLVVTFFLTEWGEFLSFDILVTPEQEMGGEVVPSTGWLEPRAMKRERGQEGHLFWVQCFHVGWGWCYVVSCILLLTCGGKGPLKTLAVSICVQHRSLPILSSRQSATQATIKRSEDGGMGWLYLLCPLVLTCFASNLYHPML